MAVIDTVLDTMLKYVTEEGLFLVYFDPLRRRMDHVVQVIICYLFHLAGRVEPTRRVREFLFKMLKRRAYLRGSLYYSSPEVFLWHLARLKPALEPKMVELLAKRVRERVGYPGDALALAMRVMACDSCGISNSRDRKQLARMQKADGSWELCPFYTYNDPNSWFANELTSTAFAVAALDCQRIRKCYRSEIA